VIDTYFNALTHLRPEVVARFKARAVNALRDSGYQTGDSDLVGVWSGWWCITCSDATEEAHHGRRRDGLSECLFCDDIVIPVWKD
jgi:hypothetical protein